MNKEDLEIALDSTWADLASNDTKVAHTIIGVNNNLMLSAGNNTYSFFLCYSHGIKPDIKKQSYSNVSIDLTDLGGGTHAIMLTLLKPEFRSTFRTIAVDIIFSCIQFNAESQIVAEFTRKLNVWSYIFKKNSSSILSKEEQIGLYGELTFISEMLGQSALRPLDVIAAWKGPDKEDKDFKYKNLAIEIKSSANMLNQPRISNIQQLDPIGLDALYLYHYSFIRLENGQNTLPAKINELRTALSGSGAMDIFEEKLISVGYLDKDADDYPNSYVLQSEDAYYVDDNFPKLTAAMCPGIISAEYIIDLNGCANNGVPYLQLINAVNNA